MTKMTVHEALCEIKVADKRIEKAIQECAFCEANKEISPKINGITVAEFENDVKAKYQKINDLIRRNENIKKALSLSNAKTVITVNGKEMTMAEAIYMMQYGIKHAKTGTGWKSGWISSSRRLTAARKRFPQKNWTRQARISRPGMNSSWLTPSTSGKRARRLWTKLTSSRPPSTPRSRSATQRPTSKSKSKPSKHRARCRW